MAPHSSHNHSHAPASASMHQMRLGIALTLALVIAELIAGLFAHSLALLSDAGHNFADAAALGFSWYALWIARKPSNAAMTFGYHRAGILTALANALCLAVIALLIGWEAIDRLHHPQPVNSTLMLIASAAAITINLLISKWLHAGSHDDLNIRGAYLHMMADALSALGVMIAAVIVAVTGTWIADPIVSFVIAALILWSSWGIVHESVQILMEAAPANIDMSAVITAIRQVPGVCDVHDLHVWTVGAGAVACSCHVVVEEQTVRDGQQILRSVINKLDHDFQIAHTTVQIEVDGCDPNHLYCNMQPTQAVHAHEH
jgi:cobalt-zinc-cadmium efflux system protein